MENLPNIDLLKKILENYMFNVDGAIAVAICDRDGFIIASESKLKDKQNNDSVIGVISAFLDIYIDRIKIEYQTQVSNEYFLQFTVEVESGEEKILAFLRLSLPKDEKHWYSNLNNSALIREIHVYGQALALGSEAKGRAQHLGLGSRLIDEAKKISQKAAYKKLAVISAIGTKEYYRNRGFNDGDLYQFLSLEKKN